MKIQKSYCFSYSSHSVLMQYKLILPGSLSFCIFIVKYILCVTVHFHEFPYSIFSVQTKHKWIAMIIANRKMCLFSRWIIIIMCVNLILVNDLLSFGVLTIKTFLAASYSAPWCVSYIINTQWSRHVWRSDGFKCTGANRLHYLYLFAMNREEKDDKLMTYGYE